LKKYIPISFIFLAAAILLQIIGCAPETEQKTKKDSTVDQMMGDYQGTKTISGESALAAQVIAYKEGEYKANILSQFDSRESLLAVLHGKRKGTVINFEGSSPDDDKWTGKIEGKQFSGIINGENDGTFQMEHLVRLSPNLGKQPPADAVVLFDGKNSDQWKQIPDAVGYINLSRIFGSIKGVIYLKSEIWSEKANSAVLELGSNDAIKAWLNEKEILSHYALRGAAPAQEKVNVKLVKGWNRLLLKITNAGGGWGTFAQFVDKNGKPLKSISEKDASNPQQKSNNMLSKNRYYITQFDLAGPYGDETMETENIHKMEFAPEIKAQDQSDVKWQKFKFVNVDYSAQWKFKDGIMEVFPGSGSLISKKKFTDFQMHIEFRSPFMPEELEQGRGNSGVYLQGFYEVQVLDSYGLEGADNECGGIYKTARPLVNMCAPPMQWQSYDITFRAPRFDKRNKKTENARLTVVHNGTLIHDNIEIPEPTGGRIAADIREPGGIMLQDHGDRVQYRNIWLIEK